MHEDVPTKAVAACFALCAFTAAIVLGMLIDNPTDTVIVRAIVCLIGGWIAGYLIGSTATRTINEAIIKTAETAKAASTRQAAPAAPPAEAKRAA